MQNEINAILEIQELLKNNNIDYNLKITKFESGNFNSYEGYKFQINVKIEILTAGKVFTPNHAKSKLVKIFTNSTYLEDYMDMNEKGEYIATTHENLKNNFLNSLYLI